MRVTIEGLRRWIVVTAALLMAVLAGYVLYGRNRFRHIERDLPGRLGINIEQTATGFSYTQSQQGHALFTLKASKELQMRSGHVLLHNVDITLYGPPGSGRTDRIYGNDFDYDQTDGIATSQGEVTIELEGMGGATSAGGGNAGNTIRVRTRGLTFAQKTGEASTAQPVAFELPRAAGTAVGAEYNSKTGVVVLDSQVRITTSSNGKSAVVEASHATLLRASLEGLLVNPVMEYETENGRADAATVYFRRDGTTERVDAQGHVEMKTDAGATVTAATARLLLDAKSQPVETDLGGGVTFGSARPGETMRGQAREGTLLFATVQGASGAQTALRHAEFRQDVHFRDAVTGLPRDPRGRAEKQLDAEKVDVTFAAPRAGQPVEAQTAVAEGSPVMTLEQMPSRGPVQTTRVSGNTLTAMLGPQNTLRQLDGTGNTRLAEEATDGSRNTSTGDVLHATFVEQPAPVQPGAAEQRTQRSAGKAAAGPKMETVLATAIQDGHVMLTETPAKKPGATAQPATLTGWADHAEYHAQDQLLELRGRPRISDGATMQMTADRIDYHRVTQNAEGSGNVKATYTEQAAQTGTKSPGPSMGGSGPVHVIAERAELDHATSVSTFYGTVQTPARMWQEADSLLAPVIEVNQKKSRLRAWGDKTGEEPVVDANFTSQGQGKQGASVVRVHSQTLVYSDATRQADFHGSVTAEQGGGAVHCENARLFLKPAGKAGEARGSQLDHMVATGHVVFTQPGRRAQGETLLYTADNGKYVLTGTAGAPARMWDRVQGTTEGASLLFNTQDDSVEVSGGRASAVTQTRAPK